MSIPFEIFTKIYGPRLISTIKPINALHTYDKAHSVLLIRMDGQTDRQTDGQTDGQTQAMTIPLGHTGRGVKRVALWLIFTS